MNRIFFRPYGEHQEDNGKSPEQFNIAVTGLGQSTGSTTIATALAFYIANNGKHTQFVQCLDPGRGKGRCSGSGLLYDAAAFDQRFANRTFHDVYARIAENLPVRGLSNMEKGINFVLPTPENRKKNLILDQNQKTRLITSARADVCIFDMEARDEWEEFLLDMDLVIVVCDPLPSKLIENADRFRRLKKLELSGCRTIWAVNKMNAGVSKRQIKGYLKTSEIFWMPHLPPEEIYGDEFACRFHYENEELRCYFMEFFTKISQTWLGL